MRTPNLKLPPLSRDQVRSVDRIAIDQYKIPGIVLMENAGRGAAEAIDLHWHTARVTLLCGPGNNGGDGYVIGRHLQLKGHNVKIVSLVPQDKLTGDAATNATIARQAEIPISVATCEAEIKNAVSGADVIVDCLLGTGAKGAPRGLYAEAIHITNHSDANRVAIDIPSGLDCDTGSAADPTFHAELTLTFVASKIGFAAAAAKPWLGDIEVIGIGVPEKLLRDFA